MASIILQSDNLDNRQLVVEFAKKLEMHVHNITDEFSEETALGEIMEKSKTGVPVDRELVMKKLRGL